MTDYAMSAAISESIQDFVRNAEPGRKQVMSRGDCPARKQILNSGKRLDGRLIRMDVTPDRIVWTKLDVKLRRRLNG